MIAPQQLDSLDPQARQLVMALMAEVAVKQAQLSEQKAQLNERDDQLQQAQRAAAFKQALIDKLTHEMAVLKRLKFAASSESFRAALNPEQRSLLDETLDSDASELDEEIDRARGKPARKERQVPKRQPLPPHLPRRHVRHEPECTICGCGKPMRRFGEDIAEKLDYQPGVFTVERHVRGKWACAHCQTLVQAPVPAQVIDKGIPTSGLLAQVLVAKFLDHLPLYRQEHIFERAGMAISRSTLAQWVGECGAQLQPLVDALARELLRHAVLHADETPVAMLKPGNKKTHKAYLWSFCTTPYNDIRAVVFRFAETRSGENVREFLRHDSDAAWTGTLVTDGYSGYNASIARGVTAANCMAHARRKFHELWVNHGSKVGEHALRYFRVLFRIDGKLDQLPCAERRRLRQRKSRRVAAALHRWLVAQRQQVPTGSATAKAIDYSLKRWAALTRFIDDGDVPISNNWIENHIRPIAVGGS